MGKREGTETTTEQKEKKSRKPLRTREADSEEQLSYLEVNFEVIRPSTAEKKMAQMKTRKSREIPKISSFILPVDEPGFA